MGPFSSVHLKLQMGLLKILKGQENNSSIVIVWFGCLSLPRKSINDHVIMNNNCGARINTTNVLALIEPLTYEHDSVYSGTQSRKFLHAKSDVIFLYFLSMILFSNLSEVDV